MAHYLNRSRAVFPQLVDGVSLLVLYLYIHINIGICMSVTRRGMDEPSAEE